jgi:chlorophyllide a reductase subunit Z
MPYNDPLSPDFDPMGDDDFGFTRPKPKPAVTNSKPATKISADFDLDEPMGGSEFGTPKAKTKPKAESFLDLDDPLEAEIQLPKPKPKPKAASSGLDDEIGFEAGGGSIKKPGTGSFWGATPSAAPAGPSKSVDKKGDLGYDMDGISGTGAPSTNAFVRKKDRVKADTEASERDRIRRMAEEVFGEEGKKAPNIPLDTPVSNGYWGAVFALTCMNDVEMVVDAPVGCYSLPATATINYTDALPELENLASSNITEIEVTLDGTTRKVLDAVRRVKAREAAKGLHKQIIVVSSQESELIGADHVMSLQRKHPDALYFTSHAFEEDEWQGRDAALLWLYQERKKRPEGQKQPQLKSPRAVNIIGPSYSCFNSYADLHELKRLIRGAGGELHYVFPFEANYADMDRLDESAINVVMYREFGESLAKELDKPYLFAPFGMKETTEFILELGRRLGTEEQAQAFVRKEKKETLMPIWDIWLGAPQDFYSTCKVAIVANESYARGLKQFLGEELGLAIGTVMSRQRSNDTNNYMLRNRLVQERPTFVMGSMNERIYMAEANLPAKFIPASLPIPLITRSIGTPYMGYRGAVYLMQLITNSLFDVLFDILPREQRNAAGRPGAMAMAAGGPPTPAKAGAPGSQPGGNEPTVKPSAELEQVSGFPWNSSAKEIFDQLIEKVPWVARISASDKLRNAAVAEARANDLPEVTPQIVMKVLPQVMM